MIDEDGTRSSNRKVATAELDKVDADASARTIIEAQDRNISQMSGRPRRAIKAIRRPMSGRALPEARVARASATSHADPHARAA